MSEAIGAQTARALQAFLAEMRQQVTQAAYFQYADLIWRSHYGPNQFDAATDLRIWHGDDGRIDGFVFHVAAEDNPEFFLRPELYQAPVADEMVAWMVQRARADGTQAIETSCIRRDERKAALLRRAGFQPLSDGVFVFLERALADPLPELWLPANHAFVTSQDRPDLTSVTGRPMTPAHYRTLCTAPGYRDDLGVRICHDDREIVAGAIGWYDDLDQCGAFEPVGTVPAHRGKGLASAVLVKIMEHLRRYGAETIYVRTDQDNKAAIGLYQKLGFHITDEEIGWELQL